VGEVVLTREEQEHKPLLGSSKSTAAAEPGSHHHHHHVSKSARARSALLLKESLVQMRKQAPDAVRLQLMKVCLSVVLLLLLSRHPDLIGHITGLARPSVRPSVSLVWAPNWKQTGIEKTERLPILAQRVSAVLIL